MPEQKTIQSGQNLNSVTVTKWDDRYRHRRVLVTGADGFIGSFLVQRLLAAGAIVSALVRPCSVNGTVGYRLRNLNRVAGEIHEIFAVDVAGSEAVERIAEWAPQVVFHLAADAYVERSFRYPLEVMRTNLGGTQQVLTAATRCAAIERVVITSSSEIYGGTRYDRINEDHPLEPTSPYAASKVAADRLAYAYHRTYGTPVAIIRPFNTFGPRHVYDVIPKFIERALRGEPLIVYGDGSQKRDFTYVDDMVEAFLCMGSHPDGVGRAVNFGTGTATSIAELAGLVVAAANSDSEIVTGAARAAEVECLRCDPSLAERLFGWHARVNLAEGLQRHVRWARDRL